MTETTPDPITVIDADTDLVHFASGRTVPIVGWMDEDDAVICVAGREVEGWLVLEVESVEVTVH